MKLQKYFTTRKKLQNPVIALGRANSLVANVLSGTTQTPVRPALRLRNAASDAKKVHSL